MVCDLNKGACFHSERSSVSFSLCDCMPMILALGNDVARVDLRRADEGLRPAGDVVLGISGSAIRPTCSAPSNTPSNSAASPSAPPASAAASFKSLVDHSFHVNVNDMQIVEDVHMILVHVLMRIWTPERRVRACTHAVPLAPLPFLPPCPMCVRARTLLPQFRRNVSTASTNRSGLADHVAGRKTQASAHAIALAARGIVGEALAVHRTPITRQGCMMLAADS